MSFSSKETVPTKWRPRQNKIMTTTVATIRNPEKRIQNQMKVLQLTDKNTNKIARSNLLKPIRRSHKFLKSKLEECNEIKANVQELKIGEMKKKFSLKIRVWVFKKSSASTKKWSKNLKTWKKKLREQEARDTQGKRRKRDLRARRNSKRKPLRRRVM